MADVGRSHAGSHFILKFSHHHKIADLFAFLALSVFFLLMDAGSTCPSSGTRSWMLVRAGSCQFVLMWLLWEGPEVLMRRRRQGTTAQPCLKFYL